jgi:hypothetical protein
MAGNRARLALPFAALLFVGIVVSCGGEGLFTPAPARVIVDGRPQEVPRGTRLGDLIRDLSLELGAGDLVSVRGMLLDAGAYPGRICSTDPLRHAAPACATATTWP